MGDLMSDYSELKALAELRAHGQMTCAAKDVLDLIADLERNQRMLLAACMDMGAIGSALNADMNSDGEELLSMVVDLKTDLDKEKALSKGWYENWKGTIVERDQLKAERDNLREDRDGLLEAGAHLL